MIPDSIDDSNSDDTDQRHSLGMIIAQTKFGSTMQAKQLPFQESEISELSERQANSSPPVLIDESPDEMIRTQKPDAQPVSDFILPKQQVTEPAQSMDSERTNWYTLPSEDKESSFADEHHQNEEPPFYWANEKVLDLQQRNVTELAQHKAHPLEPAAALSLSQSPSSSRKPKQAVESLEDEKFENEQTQRYAQSPQILTEAQLTSSKADEVLKPVRFSFFDQLGALFAKTKLQWTRGHTKSYSEYLFPIFLFVFSAVLRAVMAPQNTSWTLDSFKQGSYPIGAVRNGTWQEFNFTEKQQFKAEIQDFYRYANYTNMFPVNKMTGKVEPSYDPEYDFVGPYFYYPMACYSKRGHQFGYPVIGYVKNGNDVERALLNQYKMVFKSQQDAAQMLSLVPWFLKDMGNKFGVDMTGGIDASQLQFSQIIGHQGPQIPFEVIQYMGGVMKSDAEMSDVNDFGNFTFKEFSTRDEFMAYLEAPDYNTPAKPGMCFGFSITEDKNEYELEVFTNDKWPNIRRFSPDSELHEWLPYANMPFLAAYISYAFNGYHLIENWTANIILQLKTKNPQAKIVSLLSPQKNKPLSADGFLVFLDSTFYYFVLLMYFPLIFRTLYRLTHERKSKCKQLMRGMGMSTLSYWVSWWCSYSLVNFTVSLVCAALGYFRIFHDTSFDVLFLTLFMHGQSLFGLIWICSRFFDNPSTASTLMLCLMWLMLLIELPIDINQSWTPSSELKSMLCLCNPMLTIKQLLRVIVIFDNAKVPVTFGNGWELVRQNFHVSQGVTLLTINTFLWNTASLIVEWVSNEIEEIDHKCCLVKKRSSKAFFENKNGDAHLSIQALSKKRGDIQILSCNNLKFQMDTLVAVCGPNGAGKTRFIEELRRSLVQKVTDAKSSGNFFSLKYRLDLGILPEQQVLFDDLTPIDHLELAYRIKGYMPVFAERKNKTESLKELLVELGFDKGSKAPFNFDRVVAELSIRDRRILQIAIALSTDSQVLLLDDPFRGLDSERDKIRLTKAIKAYMTQGRERGQSRLVVYTTRLQTHAEFSDRVIYLSEGRQIERESVHEMKANQKQSWISTATAINTSSGDLLKAKSVALEFENSPSKSSIEEDWFYSSPGDLGVCDSAPLGRQQVAALVVRKWQQIVKVKKSFFVQWLVPLLVVTSGYFACRTFITLPSPSRLISPDYYQMSQKLLVNEFAVANNNQSIKNVMNYLPGLGSNFQVNYANTSSASNFYRFQNAIYNKDITSATSNYGSYLFYKLNQTDHQYQIVSFVNTTEFTATINFPAFIYEAILKSAVRDPKFSFKVRSTPYPLRQFHKKVFHRSSSFVDAFNFFTVREYIWNKVNLAQGPIFVLSAAYVIAVAHIIHYVTQERLRKMKLLELVSGLGLKSYWYGNYIFDAFCLLSLTITTQVLFLAFDPIWRASLVVYLVWPFMTLPFVYGFSFVFKDPSATQFLPITALLFSMLCVCHLVFGLRILSQFEFIGDVLTFVLRCIPNFPLANTLYTEAAISDLIDLRNFTKAKDNGTAKFGSADVWSVYNCSGDVISLIVQFVFWTTVLWAVERDEVKRIRAACRRRKSAKSPPNQTFNGDGVHVQDLGYWITDVKTNRNVVFQDVTFSVQRGELFTIVDQTAKKTAVISAMLHDLVPNSGHVWISGVDMSTVHGDYPPRLIGYSPQQICLFETLTVQEHLAYFAAIKGAENQKEIETLLKYLNLEQIRNVSAEQLSEGNRRLLQIAIATLGRPKTLIIDGAFDGLDSGARRQVCSLLQTACKEWKSTVLVGVSALSDELQAISGQVHVLERPEDQLQSSTN